MKAEKFLIALFSGIAAGAVLGLLFAPNKGSETRNKIADASKRWADEGIDLLSDLKGKFDKMTHSGNGHPEQYRKKS